ncbi:MAG: exopolysaccharide transport family protein [Chitinophagales bacterium]
MASKRPSTYSSTSLISTGIMDYGVPTSTSADNAYIQPYKIESNFTNLIEIMKSRGSIDMLTTRLVLHDLQNPVSFKNLESIHQVFSLTEIQQSIQYFEVKTMSDFQTSFISGNPNFKQQEKIALEIANMLNYDYQSIANSIDISRVPNADFLKMTFTAENPELASFAINTFSQEFIKYYTKIRDKQSDNSVSFYTSLASQKKIDLDNKIELLRQYKLNNSVINLDEQSKVVVDQIRQLEISREDANKKIPSYNNAIRNLDSHLAKQDKSFAEIQWRNQRISDLRNKINTLNAQYIGEGSKNPALAAKIKGLKVELQSEIQKTVGTHTDDLTVSVQDLREKRINAEIEKEIAEASVQSIDRELQRLRSKASSFVSKEATIAALEREIAIDSEEYLNLMDKLNTTQINHLDKRKAGNLRIIEYGLPPKNANPSNLLIISAFSGVLSLAMASLLFILLAFLDKSIKTPFDFQEFIDLNLIEYVNKVDAQKIDLQQLFVEKPKDYSLHFFRNAIRKIRLLIERTNQKVFLITSLKEGEGKTFLMLALGYALNLKGKKVLLIDSNFQNNTLSNIQLKNSLKKTPAYESARLIGESTLNRQFIASNNMYQHDKGGKLDIISSRPTVQSPAELFAHKDFQFFLGELSLHYDYIFMEGAALNEYADTQELEPYVDKVIGIFSAETYTNQKDEYSIKYLNALKDKFMGVILNKVDLDNLK